MCNGDDNPPEGFCETKPKARRSHRCCECGRLIPSGEVYVRSWGKWDGNIGTYRQHVDCHELLDWISVNLCGGEMWSFTSLRDELGEYGPDLYADGNPDKPLAVEAHARMAAIEARYAA